MRKLFPFLAFALLCCSSVLGSGAAVTISVTGMTYTMPITRTTTPSTSAVSYNSLTNGLTPWDSSAVTTVNIIGGASNYTITNWKETLSTAPGTAGSNKQYTLELIVAGVSVATNTYFETATTATAAGPFTVHPGDEVYIKCTPSNTPASTGDIQGTFTVQGPGQMCGTPSASTHTQAASTTHYLAPDQRGNQNTEPPATFPWCEAGTISNVYISTDVDPGNGKTVTVTLNDGGLGAGSISAVETGNGSTGKSGNDTTHSATIAAGDLLDWKVVVSSGATTVRVRVGFQFTPANAGDVCYLFQTSATTGQTAYTAGMNAQDTTEVRQMTMPQCRVSNLYCSFPQLFPNNGQVVTFNYRVNKANHGPTVVITGTGAIISGSDTSTSAYQITAGDTEDVQTVNTAGASVVMDGSFLLHFSEVVRRPVPGKVTRPGSRGGPQ